MEYPSVYAPRWGCTGHHLACTLQPRECTGMGKVFIFACVGWWNIVQMRM